MGQFEELLKRNLHRATCPAPIEVGEYFMGYLEPGQASKVQEHLDHCPYCHNELGILKNYLSLLNPDIQYSLTERIHIWIARLLPAPPMGLELAFAVRGDPSAGPLRYEIGDGASTGELNLEIMDDLAAPDRRMMVGLVLGLAVQGLKAALWQTGEAVAQAEVDEFGNLSIPNLARGSYDLILSGEGFEIHVQGIQV